jgi:hypothetical protein
MKFSLWIFLSLLMLLLSYQKIHCQIQGHNNLHLCFLLRLLRSQLYLGHWYNLSEVLFVVWDRSPASFFGMCEFNCFGTICWNTILSLSKGFGNLDEAYLAGKLYIDAFPPSLPPFLPLFFHPSLSQSLLSFSVSFTGTFIPKCSESMSKSSLLYRKSLFHMLIASGNSFHSVPPTTYN